MLWAPITCCIKWLKNCIDANKIQACLNGNVGIREEICGNDANIGRVLPRHPSEKVQKRYSMACETEEQS